MLIKQSWRVHFIWMLVAVFITLYCIHKGWVAAPNQICEQSPKTGQEHCRRDDPLYILLVNISMFLNASSAAITAFATVLLAYITFVLVKVTREMHIARRAWVFPVEVGLGWDIHQSDGLYHWRFRPKWRNSGDTPTRNLQIYSECELVNSPLPKAFNFTTMKRAPGTGLLPPQSSQMGAFAPLAPESAISPHDLLDVQKETKFLYLWGWALYNDVFDNTQKHITRFCFQILVEGNPFTYEPSASPGQPGSLNFPYVHHSEGNCADGECG